MNSLILTYEGFQDQEVVYPYYRLLEEIDQNGNVYLFANKTGRIFGILGCHCIYVSCNSTSSQWISGVKLHVIEAA